MEKATVDPRTLNQAELKALARRDLPRAQQALFGRYRDRLEYFAFGILHDGAEAGDVVQEVFIKAMREPRLFEEDFKTQAWLYRVTRNLCFNIVRDRRRRGTILANLARNESRAADAFDHVFSGEQQAEIVEKVGRLTEDHRAILMLRYYEDLSYTEIAARLDIKMGTVMSRLSRARDRLEAVLQEEGAPLLAAG